MYTNMNRTTDALIQFAKRLEKIASDWNGEDEQGEEEAVMAVEILEVLKQHTDEWGLDNETI